MNMDSKEIRAKKAIDSIENIERLPVSNDLLERLRNRTQIGMIQIFMIKPLVRLAIAASVAILLLFNIYTLNKTGNKRSDQNSVFASEYFSYLNSI